MPVEVLPCAVVAHGRSGVGVSAAIWTSRRSTPASKLVESNVPTARTPPVARWQVDPHRRRAEERKRRGSRSDQLHLMQLSRAGCHRIDCNIVAFNATAGSIAWSGCV